MDYNNDTSIDYFKVVTMKGNHLMCGKHIESLTVPTFNIVIMLLCKLLAST